MGVKNFHFGICAFFAVILLPICGCSTHAHADTHSSHSCCDDSSSQTKDVPVKDDCSCTSCQLRETEPVYLLFHSTHDKSATPRHTAFAATQTPRDLFQEISSDHTPIHYEVDHKITWLREYSLFARPPPL